MSRPPGGWPRSTRCCQPRPFPRGAARTLAVTGPDGSIAALGTCEHWAGEPGSLELTWGAVRRFQLTPQIAGPDVPAALDELLAGWRDHLASVPEAAEEDTAVVMTWPTRDIDGPLTLLRHGLAPRAVIAARAAGRRAATGVPVEPGVRIRQAGPADLDEVVRLGMETIRYDAHFGTVIERPETPVALRHEAGEVLAAPDPWVWLAERDGAPFGLLYAERPEAAGWIAPMVRAAPVAYLELMDVLPGERGRGVAAALVAGAAPGRGRIRGGGHAAALRAGQPAVRAVLAPAGVPAAVDLLGGQAGQHPPLERGSGLVPG